MIGYYVKQYLELQLLLLACVCFGVALYYNFRK